MTKFKVVTLIDGSGYSRKGVRLAILAQLATVVTVVAALLVGSGPVEAATQSAEIVVSGTVIASSGKADPGATVVIRAWPNHAVMQALKPGQKVPRVLVGTGTANASGKYSISLPVAKLAPEESYGVVNVEVDSKSGSHFFPLAVTRNAGDAYLPSGTVVNVPTVPGVPDSDCAGSVSYLRSLGKHLGTVGETYVLTSHATQHFVYSQGQSSSIEIGESHSGDAGSFTNAGTYSWSSSLTESWPSYGANRSVWYQTEFDFGEYVCNIIGVLFYMDVVNGFAGGADIKAPTSIPSTPARYCVHQVAGSTATSNNSAAVTWTRGLGIGTGLRFQASVQTGFDRSAQIGYHFSASRHLCGWQGDPGGRPQQLVVHT